MDGTVRTGSNWDPTEYGMFPFFRDLLLSAVLTLPCVPICKAQIDSGVDINGKQVAAFLHDVKTLEVGSCSPDRIFETLGTPHIRDKEAGQERWKYSFILGMNPDPLSGLMEFGNAYQVNALLSIGLNGTLDAVAVEHLRRGETEVLYRQGTEKGSGAEISSVILASSEPPKDLALGTTCLYSSKGHFYGWNGAESMQLCN